MNYYVYDLEYLLVNCGKNITFYKSFVIEMF